MAWWTKKKKRIADLPVLARDEARRRTRIVVIDDDPNSFPLAILRAEGYALDHWDRVKDLSKLESGAYDIIVLDIQGVANEYSADDGLGILEHLKQSNPAQIVIAFSGRTFDLSKNRFWRLADDSLSKPVDAATAKRVLDDMIEKKRTPAHYWSVAAAALRGQGVSDAQLAELEDSVTRALLESRHGDVGKAVSTTLGGQIDLGLRVTSMLLRIATLITP